MGYIRNMLTWMEKIDHDNMEGKGRLFMGIYDIVQMIVLVF